MRRVTTYNRSKNINNKRTGTKKGGKVFAQERGMTKKALKNLKTQTKVKETIIKKDKIH